MPGLVGNAVGIISGIRKRETKMHGMTTEPLKFTGVLESLAEMLAIG